MAKELSINLPWPEWTAVEQIQKSKSGRQYKAVMKEDDSLIYSIVHIFTVPDPKSSNIAQIPDSSYETAADSFVDVIRALQGISDKTNIVNPEDVVVSKREGAGYDIYLRTEYLQNVNDYFASHEVDNHSVASLGADISNAIIQCAAAGIIHKDIKPSSIYVDASGNFKLGSFGLDVLRVNADKGKNTMVTPAYLAPEL